MVYDAALVLANFVDEKGQLDLETKMRMDDGLKLLLGHKAKNLVLCGGQLVRGSGAVRGAYCEFMARYALQNIALDEDLYLENYSQETVGQAIFSKRNIVNTLRYGAVMERRTDGGMERKVIPPQHWEKIAVITSDWHVERVREIFDFVYPLFRFEMDYISVPVKMSRRESARVAEREARNLASFKKNFHFLPAEEELEIPIDQEDFRPWFATKEEYRDSLMLKQLLTTDVRYR